ncbi:hypothetical protein ACROYT_G004782 [Oculina patagonica]
MSRCSCCELFNVNILCLYCTERLHTIQYKTSRGSETIAIRFLEASITSFYCGFFRLFKRKRGKQGHKKENISELLRHSL